MKNETIAIMAAVAFLWWLNNRAPCGCSKH
jgi:hypothetical protein